MCIRDRTETERGRDRQTDRDGMSERKRHSGEGERAAETKRRTKRLADTYTDIPTDRDSETDREEKHREGARDREAGGKETGDELFLSN